MSKWIVHLIAAAACAQVGCSPPEPASSGGSGFETTDQEIDGRRLVRLGPRFHVAPPYTGTALWKYPDGTRHTARTFKNGILEGPMVSWYDDGQTKAYTVTYKKNRKDGPAIGYFPDGKKKYEINYKMGVRIQTETWWHTNEVKCFEFTWSQGRRISGKAWDLAGKEVPLPKPKPRRPLRQPNRRPPVKGSPTNQPPVKPKGPPPTKPKPALNKN